MKFGLSWFRKRGDDKPSQPTPLLATDLLARSRIDKPKALGVLLCYNDADILPDAIEALLENNHDVITWDHGSDDGTAAVLERYKANLLERTFIPRSFDFYKLYGAMSEHLQRNFCQQYHWISWPDQDEILEGPARDKSYYEYIKEVVASRYDWVQFRNFNFWFTSEDDPSVQSPTKRIRRYAVFADCSPRIRAWRASVTNIREFNHNPLQGERDPRWFNLRHYPMRSEEQMRRRLNKDRAGIQRPGMNWHYDHMKALHPDLFPKPEKLLFDDRTNELNPEPIFNWRPIYGAMPGNEKPRRKFFGLFAAKR